jgi:hypothetical protein
MENTNDNSEEPKREDAARPTESKARQELLETNKFLYITSIGCAILVALCISLGISINEIFGLPAGIFFVLGIIFAADTQKHKMKRATFYTIMSFLFFCFGSLFVTLGEHVHFAFGAGVILLYAAGAWACIMTFRMMLVDEEIIKISGIFKLICLILIVSLSMKYMVWRLNKVRQKSFISKYGTPAATVSHPNSPDNHWN